MTTFGSFFLRIPESELCSSGICLEFSEQEEVGSSGLSSQPGREDMKLSLRKVDPYIRKCIVINITKTFLGAAFLCILQYIVVVVPVVGQLGISGSFYHYDSI